MDGKSLFKAVQDRLPDLSQSTAELQARPIWKALDLAAQTFCRITRIYTRSTTLTTVLNQQDYTLPPDFLDLYMQRSDGRRFVRYAAGVDISWPRIVPWGEIFRADLATSQDAPARAAIRETETVAALIAGTTTAVGAVARGVAILTDSTKAFLTTNKVWPRDTIHDETSGADGIVVEVTDATHLKCVLFDGKFTGFHNGDAYTIVPASRMQLSLEAPAAVAGHTITVPYVGMPDPVYHDYGSWRFSEPRCYGIASGAAALLELPENSWEEARVMNGQFVEEIRRTNSEIAQRVIRETRRPARSGW